MRDLQLPGRSSVIAENGMAATAHPLGTATAISILKEGGNAVDAALAAAATLAVVEPHMSGLGGDCFAIVSQPDGTLHGLNGSGRAPAAADAAWYRDNGYKTLPSHGAHSITVPGAMMAWQELQKRFATTEFERLFADAIEYAEAGYAVHERVARDWAMLTDDLEKDEGALNHYLVGGKAPAFGSRFRSPALGEVLRAIAKDGAAAFYEGDIARDIAETVQAGGGFLAERDLAEASADWVDPISVVHGGLEICELPPNGQGITALLMLNILGELGAGRDEPDSAGRYHLEIEAGRLAYSMRDTLIGDPAHMTTSPDHILSQSYAQALAATIDHGRRNNNLFLPPLPHTDTTYISVVDRNRMAVSLINSLYDGFGSRVVARKSGIALQNRGACFVIDEGHPNELKPSKRPMHTIIPAMAMKNGKPAISFGVMGGSYQPMGHVHVLSNMLDHKMSPQEAIDSPRIFWGADGVLEAERGIGPAIRAGLEIRGHLVRNSERPLGGGQIIVIDDETGFLIGGSESRKDGLALGW